METDVSEWIVHPAGEQPEVEEWSTVADTFAGRVHIEWDTAAPVTPLGQLPFFIEYLKQGGLFDGWVADCPLFFISPNAPRKRDILGTLLLSVLAGHRRYAHVTALRCDAVNPPLLGMKKWSAKMRCGGRWRRSTRPRACSGCRHISIIVCGRCSTSRGFSMSMPRSRRSTVIRKAQWSATIRATRGGRRIAITPICYRICDWCCGLRCIPAINTIPRTPPPGCGHCWRSSGASAGRACCAVMPNGATKG